ncbi:RES domain-containing protein [Nesterenkonia sp.]|uniref:RES family NAD+ phosphorylase n=1 Tax=Nesterenkonia sp. TaxID=704201 RepID=UPI002612481D|nr:RES domain-containing protein [Nesterenkonia sp.]
MTSSLFTSVTGSFYRAIDPQHRASALQGSRSAGRYSRPDQPTLYLSSSPQGVQAAMIAHRHNRAAELDVIELGVEAGGIFDLRDAGARTRAGISLDDAVAPWQDLVASGSEPPSWGVRRRLEELGAHGLIDPSRKAPGLWHLVLFRWNQPGAPQVQWPNASG